MLVSGWTNNNNSVFLSYWCFLHYHPICSCQHRGKTENGVIKEHGLSITGATFVLNKVVHCYFSYRHCTHLLMHDDGQLSGEVPVVGLHLIVIFLLVLFDQPLVHSQPLTAGVHELPDEGCDRVFLVPLQSDMQRTECESLTWQDIFSVDHNLNAETHRGNEQTDGREVKSEFYICKRFRH